MHLQRANKKDQGTEKLYFEEISTVDYDDIDNVIFYSIYCKPNNTFVKKMKIK
jgi:hypothetical protein